MDDKDKVEALIKFADIQQKGFDKRRDIEWKVSLALWAAIFIATGFLLDHKELRYDICLIILGYIIFFIIYVIWVGKIGDSHEKDKFYRNRQREIAFGLMDPKGFKPIIIKDEFGEDEEISEYDINELYHFKYEMELIKDKDGKCIKCQETSLKFIKKDNEKISGLKVFGLFYDLWLICEIAITAMFLMSSIILLFYNHPCRYLLHFLRHFDF